MTWTPRSASPAASWPPSSGSASGPPPPLLEAQAPAPSHRPMSVTQAFDVAEVEALADVPAAPAPADPAAARIDEAMSEWDKGGSARSGGGIEAPHVV